MNEKEKMIEEMCKNFKCCVNCEMFGGYVDDNDELKNCSCAEPTDHCTQCYISTRQAKVLYNAGYRKITEPIKITTIGHGKEYGCYYADISVTGQELPQRVYFEASLFEREVTQRETAKEIIEIIKEADGADLNYIAEKYGVKVEE